MTEQGHGGLANIAPAEVKQCCARLYEGDFATYLLGDSFHPGGSELTVRLGTLLNLQPGQHVLDVASGTGASALLLAERFGVHVVGIDLSARNIERGATEAERRGLSGLVQFRVGDAERVPVSDAVFDALICECAFCTFPDKAAAVGEFARVLKLGGAVGLSDVTKHAGPADELTDLMAWMACLADAMPGEGYAEWLRSVGFRNVSIETHDEALNAMVSVVRTRLLGAEVLAGLNKLDVSGVDMESARQLARHAQKAVSSGRLGYAVIVGSR